MFRYSFKKKNQKKIYFVELKVYKKGTVKNRYKVKHLKIDI